MNDVIRLCPLFEGMSDEELDAALAFFRAERAHYAKGTFVLKPGDAVERFGLVLSGVIKIMMDDIGGHHMIMATVVSGQTFAESLCYREAKESPVYAEAAEACDILWLRLGALRGADESPHCAYCHRFISMLTRKTLSMNDRIQVLSKPSLREKLLTLLSQYSTRAGRAFNLPFDRADMAAYLGVNRSALSRELARLKSEGLIDFYKNSFTILSVKS